MGRRKHSTYTRVSDGYGEFDEDEDDVCGGGNTCVTVILVLLVVVALGVGGFFAAKGLTGPKYSKAVRNETRLRPTSGSRSTVRRVERKAFAFERYMRDNYRGPERKCVGWAEYVADDAWDGGCVNLFNKDFANGTLITPHNRPNVWFNLAETIVFSPNENDDFRPTAAQHALGLYLMRDGFFLGFYATFLMVTVNSTLEMHGHSMMVSDIFAEVQGFHSHVATSAPFVDGEGPGVGFGPGVGEANGLLIFNGKFGKTSHHGIHGNGAKRVYIHHVEFEDYMVGLAMNQWTDVLVERVVLKGSRTDVATNGRHVQARFLVLFLEVACTRDAKSCIANRRLGADLEVVEQDIIADGKIDKRRHPREHELFALDDVIGGGATYGIIITDRGAAVFEFGHPFTPATGSNGVVVRHTKIHNQASRVVEVIGARGPNGRLMTGPVGDVIDWGRLLPVDLDAPLRRISEDSFLAAQFALGHAYWTKYSASERAHFGSFWIPQEVVKWATHTDGLDKAWLLDMVETGVISWQFNIDAQAHEIKGDFAIRADSSANIVFEDIEIDNSRALGAPGIVRLMPGQTQINDPDSYRSAAGSHSLAGQETGYRGANSHGLLIAGNVNVTAEKIFIGEIHSDNGNVFELLYFD